MTGSDRSDYWDTATGIQVECQDGQKTGSDLGGECNQMQIYVENEGKQ